MAILESRPFLTPARASVNVDLQIIEPNVGTESLSSIWEPGQPIKLRYQASLSESFWHQTRIDPDEDVHLVSVATCLPAKRTWRETVRFERVEGKWRAESILTIDGSAIAVELRADCWVVGPGRIVSYDPHAVHHKGAKLWQLPSPQILKLEDSHVAFPTTAISFEQTGRLQTPWSIEVNLSAEPDWRIDSALRLYINTDLQSSTSLLDGSAAKDYYSLIQCDIQFAVLHQLAAWVDSVSVPQIVSLAEGDHTTLAALGLQIAKSLGLPLVEALRLVVEEPIKLTLRSREAHRLGHGLSTQQ